MNIKSRLLASSLALTLALTLATPGRAQSLLKVDFGVGATRLQPGFTAITGEISQSEHTETVGPYSVLLTGDGFFAAGNAGKIGEAVRPLYRDYYYNNSPNPGEGVELKLSGFAPDTNYDLTLWTYDADNVAPFGSSTPTTWTPYDGTVGPVGNVTNFAAPPYPNPTSLSQFSTTIAVTSSPSGGINVFGSTTGGGGGTRLNAARVSSGGSDLLALDFGRPDTPPSPVQSGFVGVSGDGPQFTQAVGAYTVTLEGGQGFFQTTSTNVDSIGVNVRDFFRDYYYNNATDPGVGFTLKLAGVTPNKDYELTLWTYDADNSISETPTIWEPQGATTGPVGNVTNFQEPFPTTLGEYSTTIRVRSTTSTLEIKGSSISGTGGTRLNGFELAEPTLAADFNSSTSVNATDLSIWQMGFGTATGALKANGDATGDEDVDGADFLVWQREFGASLPATAVPEPGTCAGACVAGLLALMQRRRR